MIAGSIKKIPCRAVCALMATTFCTSVQADPNRTSTTEVHRTDQSIKTQLNEAMSQQNYVNGLEITKRALVNKNDDPGLNFIFGRLCMRTKQYEKASAAFQQVLKEKPFDYPSWFNLGSCRFDLQDFPRAKECFIHANSLALSDKDKADVQWYLDRLDEKNSHSNEGSN